MVQPWDYFHASGSSGLTVENYLYRTENDTGTPSSDINTIYAQPWFTGDLPLNVLGFGIRVTTTGSAVIELAIYEAKSERDIYPGARIHQLGVINYSTIGRTMKELVATFPAGKLYWFASNTPGGTGAATCAYTGHQVTIPAGLLGAGTGSNGPTEGSAVMLGVAAAYSSGSMPDLFPTGAVARDGSPAAVRAAPAIIVEPDPS